MIVLITAVAVTSLITPSSAWVEPSPDSSKVRLTEERISRPSDGQTDSPISLRPRIRWENPVDNICVDEDRGQRCFVNDPSSDDPEDAPEITPADVERAVREIGLPRLSVQIQPGQATLVNVPTIFHTQPADFQRSVPLLGQVVDLEATPTSYRWNHGDGTTHTTTGPGRPYPDADVTHQYRHVADSLNPSVDVTYSVTYRINGGPWQTLDTPITATGPAASLRVREAAPVLVKP